MCVCVCVCVCVCLRVSHFNHVWGATKFFEYILL